MSLLVVGTLAFDAIETPYERRAEVLGGSATHFAHAARFFAPVELVGVDIDPSLVRAAELRVSRTQTRAAVHVADVRDLPFDDNSFDIVIDFGTCYHVGGGVTGQRAALSEIARVLRPGGLFVHETRVAQHLAHPVRSFGRRLPWRAVGSFVAERQGVLWTARRRIGPAAA